MEHRGLKNQHCHLKISCDSGNKPLLTILLVLTTLGKLIETKPFSLILPTTT